MTTCTYITSIVDQYIWSTEWLVQDFDGPRIQYPRSWWTSYHHSGEMDSSQQMFTCEEVTRLIDKYQCQDKYALIVLKQVRDLQSCKRCYSIVKAIVLHSSEQYCWTSELHALTSLSFLIMNIIHKFKHFSNPNSPDLVSVHCIH